MPPAEEDLRALERLTRRAIEDMVDAPPMLSETAYTPRQTVHTTVYNGFPKSQGDAGVSPYEPVLMAAAAIATAARLRRDIPGEAVLVWRHKPTFEQPGPLLYMRLCFEAR